MKYEIKPEVTSFQSATMKDQGCCKWINLTAWSYVDNMSIKALTKILISFIVYIL